LPHVFRRTAEKNILLFWGVDRWGTEK
jgi:hypothetical protein